MWVDRGAPPPSSGARPIRIRSGPPTLEWELTPADPSIHTNTYTCTHRRLYRDLAQVVGSDPSWGFGGAIATALGCTPIDLEGTEELLLDRPPARRCVGCVLRVVLGRWKLRARATQTNHHRHHRQQRTITRSHIQGGRGAGTHRPDEAGDGACAG